MRRKLWNLYREHILKLLQNIIPLQNFMILNILPFFTGNMSWKQYTSFPTTILFLQSYNHSHWWRLILSFQDSRFPIIIQTLNSLFMVVHFSPVNENPIDAQKHIVWTQGSTFRCAKIGIQFSLNAQDLTHWWTLCPYSQLHQPRFCMHFFIQETIIHQVKTGITIIRYGVNKNRNKFITKLTFHLNNGCLMINLPIIHCCINPRNTLPNISNCLYLLSIVNMRLSTL